MENTRNHSLSQFSFDNFNIQIGNETYATRRQIQDFYEVPRKTLADNIVKLKEDGLVKGAKIRPVAKDGKIRIQEGFTLLETVSIGLRLSSDKALYLQRFAVELIVFELKEIKRENKLLKQDNDRLWDTSDRKDLYRR